MAIDYIPRSDDRFDAWQLVLLVWMSDANHMAQLGLSNADIVRLSDAHNAWADAYNHHTAAQAAAKTAANAKNSARADYERVLRPFIAAIQLNPNMTDADRVAVDITVPAQTRRVVPAPTTYPVPTIDFSMRLTHSIFFRDEATPGSKAKPTGVRGAQIWFKRGGAMPTSPAEFTFLATKTKAPCVQQFEIADIGSVVYYLLRWENTTGDAGPWSEIVSAVVPG